MINLINLITLIQPPLQSLSGAAAIVLKSKMPACNLMVYAPTKRIHGDTIEQVKQRADLVEVISEHLVLKKRGKDYVGLCPFHDEKTPSFSVSPTKQLYYCFGCNVGGDAIKFLMELKKHSFTEDFLILIKDES